MVDQGGVETTEGPRKIQPTLDVLKDVSKIMAINSHWHSLIFAGSKTWELRSTPWKFRGDVGVWSDSQVHGVVTIVGCKLVALKSHDGTWEPYDDSPEAADSFVLADHNIGMHQVPMDNLLLLAKKWERIYAYTLSNPRPFSQPVPVKIKLGAQFVQNMDKDQWTYALQKQEESPISNIQPNDTEMRVWSMSRQEAFRILDTDVNLLVRTQKTKKPGIIYIAIHQHYAACIVGKIWVSGFHELRSMKAVRKLQETGYQHFLDESSKLFHPLRAGLGEGKALYGWTIEEKELIQPPLIWRSDSCHYVQWVSSTPLSNTLDRI